MAQSVTVIVEKSPFKGKNRTSFQRISHEIIGGQFNAVKDGNNFLIPMSEVFKYLELKDHKSLDLEWFKKRISPNRNMIVKNDHVRLKKD